MLRRIIIGLVAIVGLLGASRIEGYDTYVIHPKLTQAIAQTYGQLHTPLTAQEAEWLTQGALEEDEPAIRVLNHFYDPQSGRPLTVAGTALGLASPDWLHSSFRQSLVPGRGDCSWERALREYQKGKRSLAFICLGHALHLLEDASVPAHVRNDDHLEGDSYESWLKYHNPAVPSAADMLPSCTDASACIRDLARFVNEHYVSEDTISERPFIVPFRDAVVEDSFLKYEGHIIAAYNPKTRNFRLTSAVQEAYWQTISPVLLAYGRRMIELFIAEAEAAPVSNPPTVTDAINTVTEQAKTFSRALIDNGSTPTPTSQQLQEQTHNSLETTDTRVSTEKGESPNDTVDNSQPQFSSFSDSAVELEPEPEAEDDVEIEAEPLPVPDTFMTLRPASRTNERNGNFRFASDVADAHFECRLDTEAWRTCLANYSFEGLVSGRHELVVRALRAGDRDPTPISYSWFIDTTPPLTGLIGDADERRREASFRFFSEIDASYECRLDGAEWEECESPQMYDELQAVTHVFSVRSTDRVGNKETVPATYQWSIAIPAPSVPIVYFPLQNPYYTKRSQLLVNAYVEPGTSLLANDGALAVEHVDEVWSCTMTLVPGPNLLRLQARNVYQDLSDPYEMAIYLDIVAPSATIIALPESYEREGFTVGWQGLDDTTETLEYEVEYRAGEAEWVLWQDTSATEAIFSEDLSAKPDLAFRVRARDRSGNVGDWSSSAELSFADHIAAHLVISQVLTGSDSDSNEFVELYNPSSHAVFLNGYRLETTSTQDWHVVVPAPLFSEAYVPAHGYFLITGSHYDYNVPPDIRLTTKFLPDEDAALRLINAENVEIDRLGYGSGEGERLSTPNPEPSTSLERKHDSLSSAASLRPGPTGNGYDSDTNRFDFVLQTDVRPRASHNRSLDSINSDEGLAAVWHFDECDAGVADESLSGEDRSIDPGIWIVGRFGCGMKQQWFDPIIRWTLPRALGPELTMAFYVRDVTPDSLGEFWLTDATGIPRAGTRPRPFDSEFRSNGQSFGYAGLPNSTGWHHIALTYSAMSFAWYVDGELIDKRSGDYRQTQLLTGLYIDQNNTPWNIDEIALWSRALSAEEIQRFSQQQVSPHLMRPPQPPAELLHYWDFEGVPLTIDRVGGVPLLNPNRTTGRSGLALYSDWPHNRVTTITIPEIRSRDMSLSFWVRDLGGRNGDVKLLNPLTQMSFGGGGGGIYDSVYYHNGMRNGIGAMIPSDGLWHQIAVVYDSYAYEMRYYIDGEQRATASEIWQRLPLTQLVITEEQGVMATDDIKIFQGVLQAEKIVDLANE